MCGRFTLASDPGALQAAFPGIKVPEQLDARYNVAPTQAIAVVRNNDAKKIEFVWWGLIPFWAQDASIGNRMINARAETLAEKPAFRTAFRRRRCLILADGFYEWQKDNQPGSNRKVPLYIRLKGGRPFAFAGLWDEWRSPEGELRPSATIITTSANALLERIHNRMPVILHPESYERWLDPTDQDPTQLAELLQPFPENALEVYEVSTLVNDPRHESAELVKPV